MESFATWIAAAFHGITWWVWMLQFFGVVLSLIAADMNSRMNIYCFYLWSAAGLMMLVVHVTADLWLLIVMDILYLNINYRAIKRWSVHRPGDINS